MKDGQHRTRMKFNTPTKRNCFFCLKDKMCTIVTLPETTIADMRRTAMNNPALLGVINEVATAQFACCETCRDLKAQARAIVGYIQAQYEIKRHGG